jgi:ribonuclease-3
MNLAALESELGLHFRHQDLLREALTHRSYLNENPGWKFPNNERLEFLGDAVLELVVTEYLFQQYPETEEGKLTLFRAALVNTKMLSEVAESVGLAKHLLVSRGESQVIGRASEAIFADAFEALIGALYLDQGYAIARKFIARLLFPRLAEIVEKGSYKDAKSLLQEIVQADYRITPTYRVLEEAGPDHQKIFRVGVYFEDELKAEGRGSSKQEAEIAAARQLLSELSHLSDKNG